MNTQIVKKIKDRRIEKGLTQKDLADHLGRTSAAISDLERGKVQVTASDLYRLSDILEKPIEYFYGVPFDNEDVEGLTILIRNMDPEIRKLQIPVIQSLLSMQMKVKGLDFEDEDKEKLREPAREIYDHLIVYLQNLRQLLEIGFQTKGQLEEVLGIDESGFPDLD